jgi:hypothetical protein
VASVSQAAELQRLALWSLWSPVRRAPRTRRARGARARALTRAAARAGGSSGWQAPEQLISRIGGDARQGRGTDVFSFGLLAHYCLSGGRHAFGESYERDFNILQARGAGAAARIPDAWNPARPSTLCSGDRRGERPDVELRLLSGRAGGRRGARPARRRAATSSEAGAS